jgi:RNA polymerase sigma-70 factor (ECF subfamily)
MAKGEQELVAACQRGDRDAFRRLFESYKDRVYSIALRFAGNPNTAMDIAQDTFLKLFSSIRDFRGESSFDTWIYRLVVNSCMDHRRKAWRLMPLAGEFLGTLKTSGGKLDDLLREEADGRLREAVEKLPANLKITVVLRYTQGLSYEEIAEVLGCSAGTVASRLNRAHKTLERTLLPWVEELRAGYA